MKAQTKIAKAVKAYRDSVSDYMRYVYNVPNIPKVPDVRWRAGHGWTVDDQVEPGDAPAIVTKYETLTAACGEAIKEYRTRPAPKKPRADKRESAVKGAERSGTSQAPLDGAEREP